MSATAARPLGSPAVPVVLAAVLVAVFAALTGVMMQAPDAHARTLAFLDQYVAAVPWTAVLMATPLMLVIAWVALRRPVLLVYATALLLPLNLVGQPGELRILAFGKVLVNGLFVAALVMVAVAPREWRRWLTTTRLGWWLCAFCACLGFAAIQGYFAGYDLYEWMRELGWLAFYAFAIPVGVFVRTRRQLEIVVALLVAGALVTLVLSLLMLTTAPRFERAEDWTGGSTFIRAPFSEGMRFVLLWAVVNLFVVPRWALGNWRTVALVTLALALSVGLLASLARSLWLTTLIALGVVMALVPHNRKTAGLLLLSLGGAAVAVAGIEFLDRLSPFSSGRWLSDAVGFVGALLRGESASSTIGRQVEWANAIRLWLDSPFIGGGIGAPFERTIYSAPDLAAFFTHNSYLNVLAKTGVVGFTALTALGFKVFRLLNRVRRAPSTSPADRVLAITITAYMVGVLIHSIGAATITTTDTVMLFSLLIGLAVALARIAGLPELLGEGVGLGSSG